ncbi:hypothetical protein [Oceanospirillum linum]|uniref:DUF2489 domain-containing protein n=1 Tax=Oceanospirillum linum TaxID=966 RepID=A0A1T1HAC7_OCELI|nr:hypothetical protein [Oceanospirillum linum]OOV86782.1 hypothetical protein BTA35_0210765 [Oceanospirillum linum]SEG22679.1 hypothetical protein SAMN04489856_106186 [Oleiphilus messinensis]SMP25424.1 hypothetical protein SAMN06264348_105185 [Oceanospirillum linum]
MKEYIGFGIVVFSLIFAISAAFMAWRLKLRLDAANSVIVLEKSRRDERRKTYQDVIAQLEQAMSSVNNGRPELANLFNDLSPKLHLHASEEVNSSFVEVCLLLENWTAMKDDVDKTVSSLQENPDHEVLEQRLSEQKKQALDAYQLFKHKFNKLGAMMRKEMSEAL